MDVYWGGRGEVRKLLLWARGPQPRPLSSPQLPLPPQVDRPLSHPKRRYRAHQACYRRGVGRAARALPPPPLSRAQAICCRQSPRRTVNPRGGGAPKPPPPPPLPLPVASHRHHGLTGCCPQARACSARCRHAWPSALTPLAVALTPSAVAPLLPQATISASPSPRAGKGHGAVPRRGALPCIATGRPASALRPSRSPGTRR